MPSITPKRYLGVSFIARVVGPKKWRAQIIRQSMVLALGAYETPEEAARAYDNASFHLRDWAENTPQFNFPAVWTGENVPPASMYSTRALARLKERYPNYEREKAADQSLNEFERVQRDAMIAIEHTTLNMTRVRTALLWAFGQLKMQDAAIKSHAEELAARDRIIAGLRATGGKSFMRLVEPVSPNLNSDPV